MADYKTIRGTATFEYEEKRSRFIATASFADTEEKALAVLNAVRAANRTARHNVYAYVLQNGRTRYSDDGEPAKTAGTPVLETIGHAGVADVIVVVTRYFGGILLGTGGLVRAYTQAVKEGLAHCETGILRKGCELEVTTDYNDVGKLQYYFGQQGIVPVDSIYAENVKFILLIPVEKEEKVRKNLTETTCGKVKIEKLKETYRVKFLSVE